MTRTPVAGGTFRIGVSCDLRTSNGVPSFGWSPLALIEGAGDATWEWLPPLDRIGRSELSHFDALYINTPPVTAAAFPAGPTRTAVIARHGVGFDSVDIAACTHAEVLVTIQPDGVRRPVAVAALTMVLALSQRLLIKDRLTRAGRWDARLDHFGTGLVGRTLGVVGAGSIGRELLALARPFGLRLLAADPFADPAAIAAVGARITSLDALLDASDFIVVLTPLLPQTRGLIGASELARMKRSAFLVNMSRGPVLDEAALIAALSAGQIAGAGLDVFAQEPVEHDNALLAMEQVILTPHSLCWTDECFAGIAESGFRSILSVRNGRIPPNAVNPEAARNHLV